MPTQYGRLLKTPPRIRDAGLLSGLQEASVPSLAEFLRRCNETRSMDEQIPAPPARTDYLQFDPRLLAHLWSWAHIFPALPALAQLSREQIPSGPDYTDMSVGLLHQLWQLAEDRASLLELLRRGDPEAERELLRLCNKNRSQPLAAPAEDADYSGYPDALLAVLWAMVHNEHALRALGRRTHLAIPDPPVYSQMSDELLHRLWALGKDGDALAMLWEREDRLPLDEVSADSPEALLGFLAWHENRTDARDELLGRYALLDASPEQFLQRYRRRGAPWPYQTLDDYVQDVRVKFLQQIETWDYLLYPTLENRFLFSLRNMVRDKERMEFGQSALGDMTETEPVAPRGSAEPAKEEGVLDASPMNLRVILKIQDGMDLNEGELAWSADENLRRRDIDKPTFAEQTVEQQRIRDWLVHHPHPTGQQLVECFTWHDPCRANRIERDFKLRRTADVLHAALQQLSQHFDPEIERLAERVVECSTALVQRTTSGKRRGLQAGTVALFATLQEAGALLWQRLGERPLDWQEREVFAAGRASYHCFGDLFPALLRLAPCRRLLRALASIASAPLSAVLMEAETWLEKGQWLATFTQRDREVSRGLVRRLEAVENHVPAGERSTMDVLLLWLRSLNETGAPEARMLDLDRAWHMNQRLPEASALVVRAVRGDWIGVSAIAGQMLTKLPPPGRMTWSKAHEQSEALKRLACGESDALVKVSACRRLLDSLRENASAALTKSIEELAQSLDQGKWRESLEQVRQSSAASSLLDGQMSALQLLGLWLHLLSNPGPAGQDMEDIDRLWRLSHEPEFAGPGELRDAADRVVSAAWRRNWHEAARAAKRAIPHCPDSADGMWTARHEFRQCLERLANRRGKRR